MNVLHPFRLLLPLVLFTLIAPAAQAQQKQLPDPLKSWQDWVLWDIKDRANPPQFNNPYFRPGFWPSRMDLSVDAKSGRFSLTVNAFEPIWIALPGDKEMWPQHVTLNGAPAVVIDKLDHPSVKLDAGVWKLAGTYAWDELPQRIPLPTETGILTLAVDGKPVSAPTWDEDGMLWLKRAKTGEAEKDFLGVQVYRAIEDGIPMWLQTEVELTVAGKSREEDIGNLLPEGWKLAQVESALPVAVDDAGRMKAQVRAGRWKILLHAFRLNSPATFTYAAGVKPAVADELIAFRAKPDFRLVEITGVPAVDVAQTTMPEQWRDLPVYRWETGSPFQMEERMRGMGLQTPEGLSISRRLWLDQDGRGLTFRDEVFGHKQELWRLDAAAGQDLGSVRINGKGQLITLNPATQAPGVELRTRDMSLEATGRAAATSVLPATGWQTDATSVKVVLNLPPGWRLLAVFGSDWVQGDWLTSWTLLDIFLLLVFSLAVFRLWGLLPGVLAFFAFGLTYHEPEAPVYAWLFLLVPLALLRVVPAGRMRRLVTTWKWIAVASLVLILIPFASRQIQGALYPQLDQSQGFTSAGNNSFGSAGMNDQLEDSEEWQAGFRADIITDEGTVGGQNATAPSSEALYDAAAAPGTKGALFSRSMPSSVTAWKKGTSGAGYNLSYDSKARIQTGPGVPEWSWRTVGFGWNGPVTAEQTVHPILLSRGCERILLLLQLLLVLALAAVLLGVKLPPWLRPRRMNAALLLGLLFFLPGAAQAQIPDNELLQTLRNRLTETADAFPDAAEIPQASITLRDRKITIDAEIHTAAFCTVPLPGRIPAWSPLSVTVDGRPEPALRRAGGFLWIALSSGVHRVHMEGLLPEGTDWEWDFALKPRLVSIDAPGWACTGVRPNGVPEDQIFFTRQQKAVTGEASYDRRDYQSVVAVDRALEIGLLWKVRTTVRRLSSGGKAVSLRVPLLPGENVLTSDLLVNGGCAEVRLGAQDNSISWESELPITEKLALATKPDDAWIESWTLTLSPVWNVALSGLPPVFDQEESSLTPVWHPWPGETAELSFSRPEAVQGATMTIRHVERKTTLGLRQRTSVMTFNVECSLGQDMPVELPSDAEIVSVTYNDTAIPVRKDNAKVIIPIRPGPQLIRIEWKENTNLGFLTRETAVRLPVECANVATTVYVPDNRWVLWTGGPLQGPAVRFWTVLAFAALAAWILGRLPLSPLNGWIWMLLALGLTQVPTIPALIVVAWFFLLAWRGNGIPSNWPDWRYNLTQIGIILWTLSTLGILISAVSAGLLGDPNMFILGNGSSRTVLRWYQARCDGLLPEPLTVSVSIWFYRFLMLAWALWLAFSLLRWLKKGWEQFGTGGLFKRSPEAPEPTPPAPPAAPTLPPQA